MKFMKYAVLGFAFVSSQAFAAPINCEIETVVRCMCERSMSVSCENGDRGYIQNDVKPLSVTIVVEGDEREFEIKKPTAGIRSYYVPAALPEVLKMLNDAGVVGSKDDLWNKARTSTFRIDSSVELFDTASD